MGSAGVKTYLFLIFAGSSERERPPAGLPHLPSTRLHRAASSANAGMSARASVRERDAWDISDEEDPEERDEGSPEAEVDDEDEAPAAPTSAAPASGEDMQDRMAEMESGGLDRLGDTAGDQKLSKWELRKKQKAEQKKWKNEQKTKGMEQLANMTPSFSSAATFDMDEMANPMHGKVQIDATVENDGHTHANKMLQLRTMGNHGALVARIQDAPVIKHTFKEQHRKIVMCVEIVPASYTTLSPAFFL